MRISNLLSAVGATALILGGLTVRAQDNPDQAAARAALMDKLKESNAQAAPTANQTQTMAPVKPPADKPAPAPAPEPAAAPAAPAPAGGGDTPEQSAARAALMQKMNELNAQQPPAASPTLAPMVMKPSGPPTEPPQPAAPPAKPTPAPVAAVAPAPKPRPMAAPVPAADESGFFTPVPPASNPPVQAGGMRATSTGYYPGTPAQSNPQPAAKPAPPDRSPASANYIGKSLGFQPIQAPPPPVSEQKQAALQSLLARYMANQISPEEYQKERAAILAEP